MNQRIATEHEAGLPDGHALSFLVAGARTDLAMMAQLAPLTLRLQRIHPRVWNHSIRVTGLMVLLNARMQLRLPRRVLVLAGLLHDIGMIAVPPGLVESAAVLAPRQRQVLERHVLVGSELLQAVTGLQQPVLQAALYHHERWDGSGYPSGLSGLDTPLIGRLCGLAVVLDALTADDRAHRIPKLLPEAVSELVLAGGTQFDPMLATALGNLLMSDLERATALPLARQAIGDMLTELETVPASGSAA